MTDNVHTIASNIQDVLDRSTGMNNTMFQFLAVCAISFGIVFSITAINWAMKRSVTTRVMTVASVSVVAAVFVSGIVWQAHQYSPHNKFHDLSSAVQHDLTDHYRIRSASPDAGVIREEWSARFPQEDADTDVNVVTHDGGQYTYQVSYEQGHAILHPQSSGDRNAPSPTELRK